MSKPIAVIADELIEKNHELKRENTCLKQQVRDLEEALKHCQARTYGDDLADDDDSCGQFVVPQLKG